MRATSRKERGHPFARFTACVTLLLIAWVVALEAAGTPWALPIAVVGVGVGIWLVITEGRA